MQQIFTELKNQLAQGNDTVLVTVVATHGSTPRGAGARMLVNKHGRLCGTIGGGAVEYRSEQIAVEAIQKSLSQLKNFELNNEDIEDLGMICGGNVTLYFRFISGQDSKILYICNFALAQFKEQKTTWLITELTDQANSEIGLYSEKLGLIGINCPEIFKEIKGCTTTFTWKGRRFYAEQLLSSGYVYIFGGGHVAQELVPVLSHLQFRCIVHEDREEFLRPELFPGAMDIRKVDFYSINDLDEITSDDYVVIMTRGHAFDQVIQEQVLRTPAKYIGVIGSMSKRADVQASIISHGFTAKDVQRITTPIGLLNVKGETPAEIAISIAGQLITLRSTGEILQ